MYLDFLEDTLMHHHACCYLQGSIRLWGLRPACREDTPWLLQLIPPDMLAGVRADGREQLRLHL